MAHGGEHRPALQRRQDDQQRQQREEAAPEGHLKARRMLQVARDHTGNGPHEGHGHHQRHGTGMCQFQQRLQDSDGKKATASQWPLFERALSASLNAPPIRTVQRACARSRSGASCAGGFPSG